MELLEKRIAQLEAIVESSSKNVPNVTADKDTKPTANEHGGTDKGTAANGTDEVADTTLDTKVSMIQYLCGKAYYAMKAAEPEILGT